MVSLRWICWLIIWYFLPVLSSKICECWSCLHETVILERHRTWEQLHCEFIAHLLMVRNRKVTQQPQTWQAQEEKGVRKQRSIPAYTGLLSLNGDIGKQHLCSTRKVQEYNIT